MLNHVLSVNGIGANTDWVEQWYKWYLLQKKQIFSWIQRKQIVQSFLFLTHFFLIHQNEVQSHSSKTSSTILLELPTFHCKILNFCNIFIFSVSFVHMQRWMMLSMKMYYSNEIQPGFIKPLSFIFLTLLICGIWTLFPLS